MFQLNNESKNHMESILFVIPHFISFFFKKIFCFCVIIRHIHKQQRKKRQIHTPVSLKLIMREQWKKIFKFEKQDDYLFFVGFFFSFLKFKKNFVQYVCQCQNAIFSFFIFLMSLLVGQQNNYL